LGDRGGKEEGNSLKKKRQTVGVEVQGGEREGGLETCVEGRFRGERFFLKQVAVYANGPGAGTRRGEPIRCGESGEGKKN